MATIGVLHVLACAVQAEAAAATRFSIWAYRETTIVLQ